MIFVVFEIEANINYNVTVSSLVRALRFLALSLSGSRLLFDLASVSFSPPSPSSSPRAWCAGPGIAGNLPGGYPAAHGAGAGPQPGTPLISRLRARRMEGLRSSVSGAPVRIVFVFPCLPGGMRAQGTRVSRLPAPLRAAQGNSRWSSTAQRGV